MKDTKEALAPTVVLRSFRPDPCPCPTDRRVECAKAVSRW
jgi:hypothetical protein